MFTSYDQVLTRSAFAREPLCAMPRQQRLATEARPESARLRRLPFSANCWGQLQLSTLLSTRVIVLYASSLEKLKGAIHKPPS